MEYIKRTLEEKFLGINSYSKAILLTGARQVGKTTMLKHLADGTNRRYVNLDDVDIFYFAKNDPKRFLEIYKPPILIDEIQRVPELFKPIKIMCDESESNGLFWLTGSKKFSMMKLAGESLAGRIMLCELYSLSQKEKMMIDTEEFKDFSFLELAKRKVKFPNNKIESVYRNIWEGGIPKVQGAEEWQIDEYFNSLFKTNLYQDAVESGGVSEIMKFKKFIQLCALYTAQQINYSRLAQMTEISEVTAKKWINLLEGLGIIYLLQPYENNQIKRLTKTPKLYFCDTGFATHLSSFDSFDRLMHRQSSGYFFENYVVMEFVRNMSYAKSKESLFYYRDLSGNEIDLLLFKEGVVHPFEIKLSQDPRDKEVKKFEILDRLQLDRGNGGIICMCNDVEKIDEKNTLIPCNII